MNETLYALLAIALVLTLVSVLVPLAERLRLPHTVLLALAGLGLGFAAEWMISQRQMIGALGDAFAGLDRLEIGTEYFLPVFLPPLLFTAGMMIDVRRLLDEISAVLLLAIVAVLVCIGGVAAAVHYATGADMLVCLLLGAVVSTTDPAAVIGIFREVGAPKRLSILAEGESLLNDAVAIAAFGFVIGLLTVGPASISEHGPIYHFVRDFAGGIVFGYLMALAAMFVLPRLNDSEVAIGSVTVSLAYASYVIADHYLGVSGVVSVVMAALTTAAYGPTRLHPRQWTALQHLWEQLEFWGNCLIFVLASMAAAKVLVQIKMLYVWGVLAVAGGAFTARALVVFGMFPILEATRLVQPVDNRYKSILVWGGLRGAVTIVLATVVLAQDKLPGESGEFVAVVAVLFVLFTLLICATTLGLVMRLLGLDKLSRVELALRDRVLALSRVNVAHHLQEVIRTHNQRVEGLEVDPVSSGETEIEPPPPELDLTMEERLKVGLLTLCTQEKDLYLELFEQQTLSRRMIALLAARADRMIDAVRDRGVEGFDDAVHSFAQLDWSFRLALWLHRRLGFEKALTLRLADRFEILMVSQDVLAELAAFNLRSVGDLLGLDAETKLAEIIKGRQQMVDRALKALSLQYPGYAEAIKDREIERAAIRFESAEYTRRLRESIIGREVYADLRRRLNERRSAVRQRPPLDLGLQLAGMIGRVPLFASLDEAALREVGRRLRPLVALPGEKIIRVGGPPDAMYFIASGEVAVQTPVGAVHLKDGAFFGEMGLLSAQPRTADVVADGYVHLLVLYRKDFNEVLEGRPQVRAEIEAMAKRRDAENRAQSAN